MLHKNRLASHRNVSAKRWDVLILKRVYSKLNSSKVSFANKNHPFTVPAKRWFIEVSFICLTSRMPLQQNAHSIAQIICQRCNRFSGYPREEKAEAHIDSKIDCNVHGVVHAGAVKVIVEKYIQRLHNQKLPYNQGKAFFS